MSRPVGIPLLSGPPPPSHSAHAQNACRKCGREFSLLFNRQRKCMHCGYGYCSSCTDYRALMPRGYPAQGYDTTHVCAFCIEMLNVTCFGRAQLRSLPLAKLRRYIHAYNIPIKNPIDKNDLVDALLAARTPQGCLSPANEDHYRKHSVPSPFAHGSPPSSSTNRSSSTRGFSNTNANSSSRSNTSFPRPDLDPNRRQGPQETAYSTRTPHSTPNTPRSRTTSVPINPGATRPTNVQPNNPRPTSSAGRQSTPRPTSTSHTSSQSQTALPLPPPPMSTLVTLPRSSLSALSVGTLKQVLRDARVRVPPGVVEKKDLVDRVWAIVEEEKRKDNEGIDDFGSEMDEDEMEGIEGSDREEEAVVEIVDPASEVNPDVVHEHAQGNNHPHTTATGVAHGHVEDDSEGTHEQQYSSTSLPKPSTSLPHPFPKSRPRSNPKSTNVDHSGLCVICQDEEANIAIVDCGHLAMCRACSDLVLASSRECPLCRTRIVTEARLLRIFKT